MFRRTAVLALALALFVGLTPSKAQTTPFEINVVLSVTGAGAFLGTNEVTSLTLIEQRVNKAGGINGRPIKFVIQDDQSSPQLAVQLTNSIMAKNVSVIIGSSLAASCTAMMAITKKGPVQYCLSAGVHPDKGSYTFAYGTSTTDLIEMTIRYFREHNLKRIGFITSTDTSGQDGEHGVDQILALPENKDVSLVAREHYAVSDVNVTAQMTRIKAANPQAVIGWGTGAPFGKVLRGANDVGLDVPISGSASNLIYAEMKQFAGFLPKDLITAGPPCIVPDAIPRGGLRSAVDDYVSAFMSTGVRPDLAQAVGWDPALIVVAAYKKLGFNATAEQVREFIANLHGWAGANGVYDFRTGNQRGLDAKGGGIMVRWDSAKDSWIGVSKLGGAPL